MYIENNIIKNRISIWLIFMFFLIVLMITVGGLTRLTDSGLSITKWELFYGTFPPLNEKQWIYYFEQYKLIPEYQLQNFSMTLDEFKFIFWWEWAHRFLGRLIGIAFLIPLIYFTIKLSLKKLLNFYLIFFLICFQGFIGWYMVSSGLINRVDVSHFRLSLHLIVAFFILSLILWNYLKINIKDNGKLKLNIFFPLTFLVLIFLQIIIGAFVSGMDAGLIYNSWPLMGNTYFPNDNEFINLFNITVFSNASLVQFVHRNLAYLILAFYFLMLFRVYKLKIESSFFAINLLGFFLLLQVILGILTLLNGVHILLASMHQISSIFLVSASIYFLYLNKKINSF
tara:strand:+ start:6446 stop:7468 length:1023 start_codon:yes stop_codon:yes gene_type:complete